MKIIISGQHMNVGDSLKSHIEESMQEHVKKYFVNAITSSITITMERPHYFRTDILINEGTGKKLVIRSTAHDTNAYHSFDEALIKVIRQMRRHKKRISEHQKGERTAHKMAFLEATNYVISPYNSQNDDEGDAPAIIAEKITEIQALSVVDAVMKMDLENLTTYIFTNSGTNRLNVIYYREDGNIAWIDIPKQ